MDGSDSFIQPHGIGRRPAAVTPPSAAVALPSALLPLRTTTRHVARPEQFEFWRSRSRLVDLAKPEAAGPQGFEAEETTWRIGPMALMTANVAACTYRRTATQIRRDGLDHWTISIAASGGRRFRTDDGAVLMKPGVAYVTSLGVPYDVDRVRSSWIHLFVPRDALPARVGTRCCSRPLALETAMGQVLRDYLVTLAARLPAMRDSEVPHLAEATRALVAAALLPDADGGGTIGTPGDAGATNAAGLVLVRRLVREHFHSVTFGPEKLCRLSGISRTQLYRILEPYGGIAAYIQDERLRAAERMLRDTAEARSITEIATSVGLCDPSSFGRMFRRRFGCSPSEMREAALTGHRPNVRQSATVAAAPQDVSDVLRALL